MDVLQGKSAHQRSGAMFLAKWMFYKENQRTSGATFLAKWMFHKENQRTSGATFLTKWMFTRKISAHAERRWMDVLQGKSAHQRLYDLSANRRLPRKNRRFSHLRLQLK